MLFTLLVTAALLGAPDENEAQKTLRIAWASQYEWKEDDVANATIAFVYEQITSGGEEDVSEQGRGTIVIVGDEVARVHFDDARQGTRDAARRHLEWVAARFVRKKFEEEFKDVEWKAPEKAAGGAVKIAVSEKLAFLVKNGRIIAREHDVGTRKRPYKVRTDYTVSDVRDGYGRLSETLSHTRGGVKTAMTAQLTLRNRDDGAPSPKVYRHTRQTAGRGVTFKIEFEPPKFNTENPIVLDKVARDMLREGWETRFVLPDEIRIVGKFQRKIDKDLAKARWTGDVRGEFQVWGMDDINAAVDTKASRRSGGGQVQDTVQRHLREGFARYKATPFDVEFKGCGFTKEESEDGKAAVIRVIGYEKALAFRIEKGAINGRLDVVEGEEGWWLFKLKKTPDGFFLIDKMERKFDDRKIELRFKYSKKKGFTVPTRIDAIGTSRWQALAGVATYTLKRLKVSLPDG